MTPDWCFLVLFPVAFYSSLDEDDNQGQIGICTKNSSFSMFESRDSSTIVLLLQTQERIQSAVALKDLTCKLEVMSGDHGIRYWNVTQLMHLARQYQSWQSNVQNARYNDTLPCPSTFMLLSSDVHT